LIEQRNSAGRVQLRRALEKSLDVVGEGAKTSLMNFLEKEYGISFAENSLPRLEDIESALRSVLGQGAGIITGELRKNLGRPERTTGRRAVTARHGKSLA
jgi:hypothetical protein